MPFKSYRQQRFMFAKVPEVAEKWAKKYGTKKKPKNYQPRPKKNEQKGGVLR